MPKPTMNSEPINISLDFDGMRQMTAVVDVKEDKPSRELRAGDLCPRCQEEHMDYDGLLNLACPKCGYTLGGCFT